jgi:VWFA-related protein
MLLATRVSILLVLSTVFAGAQQSDSATATAPQTTSSQPSLSQTGAAQPLLPRDAVRPIKLDVVVTGHGNKVVPDLQQQEFTVLDNKQPAKVISFQAESAASGTPDSRAEIVFVIDEVNTTFQRVAYVRAEIKKFLAQDEGKLTHPVSLVFFSDSGTQIQTTPALDGNALIAALDQHENALRTLTRSTGIYGAEDRLKLSLDALEEVAAKEATRPGRKLVLWVSPGWPLLSGPHVTLSQSQSQNVFNSVVKISTVLRQARVTLYSLDPLQAADAGGLRTVFYQNFLKGLTSTKNAQIADLSLQVLATQSGGLVLYGNNSIADWINRCASDASAFYVLTLAGAPADRGNEYHDIEVKVATPGLTARTRTGYYAQP